VTIAMCYVSPEGLVLGADSTSSTYSPGFHHFDHNQKLYEVGENSTLGILTWELGGLGAFSYRTMIATLSDGIDETPPASVLEVTVRWTDLFWPEYTRYLNADPYAASFIQRAKILDAKVHLIRQAPLLIHKLGPNRRNASTRESLIFFSWDFA
jgi:hypothetical protein